MIIKILPAELMGLIVLISAIVTEKIFPEISDFWLALATAITLFLIMHVRTHMEVNAAGKEKPSP